VEYYAIGFLMFILMEIFVRSVEIIVFGMYRKENLIYILRGNK